jgi:Signal transduction histidine kinase
MIIPNKIRLRFALWATALVFAAIALYGAFVFFTMDVFLHASTRDSLRLAAEQVASSLEVESGAIQMPEHLWESSQRRSGHGLAAVCLIDKDGNYLLREGWAAGLVPHIPQSQSQSRFQLFEPDLAVYSLPLNRDGAALGFVQVAQSTEGLEHMLKELLAVLALTLPFFLVASAASGYFLASRLLSPIDLMTRTARKFSEEDLSARIGLVETDDEIGRLAETFDEMLERIEDSFTRYRQFTADASHELRTPISVIQAILEVTKRRPRSVDEYRAAMDDLGAAAFRLEKLVSALMTLSRADMDAPIARSEVDLSDLLQGSVDSLRPLAEEKGLAISAELESGLSVEGDSDALIQVFVNVIGNAIKYTESGSIFVRAKAKADGAEIEVRDTGIGMPESELPRIFDRFYRVDRSRASGGSGLGLAISRSIVERHGGRIGARSELGVGTSISITLPRSNNRRA